MKNGLSQVLSERGMEWLSTRPRRRRLTVVELETRRSSTEEQEAGRTSPRKKVTCPTVRSRFVVDDRFWGRRSTWKGMKGGRTRDLRE